MPDWIAENAFMPVMTGLLVSGMLGAFAFMLQSRSLVFLASIVGVLALSLIAVERYIVTDNEKVERLLYQVANAVEFNRHNEVLSYIKQDSAAYGIAENELDNYQFRVCNITGIRSQELDEHASPMTATITFVVFVDVNAPTYQHDGFGRREVTLWLEKQADESWKIVNYSHRHPTGAAKL